MWRYGFRHAFAQLVSVRGSSMRGVGKSAAGALYVIEGVNQYGS